MTMTVGKRDHYECDTETYLSPSTGAYSALEVFTVNVLYKCTFYLFIYKAHYSAVLMIES